MRAARHSEGHLSHRSNWLRAAVLGANDGIVSTASLVLGVAASGASSGAIVTAGIAGLVAGALSMAAGEFVSVSSQRDSERADLRLEEHELRDDPHGELRELTRIYEKRGVPSDLARQVAVALTERDSLGAHARDEFGLSSSGARGRCRRRGRRRSRSRRAPCCRSSPWRWCQLAPGSWCASRSRCCLGMLGALGARLGGADQRGATARVVGWGALAMAVTAGIGALVGAAV
jgi:vacuolar iron transporter family protein